MRCPVCDEQVRYRPTKNNRPMALNYNQDPGGNVIISNGVALVVHDAGPDVPRWMPHAATCDGYREYLAKHRKVADEIDDGDVVHLDAWRTRRKDLA